jgi:CRISPR-associated protein Cmr4
MIFLHALSPLHAGTGQGVGVIDLPIAREKATNIPYLPGSSLKGVLRDACSDSNLQSRIFGPSSGAEEYAGSVQVTDLRLLFLPVRSISGTFAWVTSPLLLERFRRDAVHAPNVSVQALPQKPTSNEECIVSDKNCELLIQVGSNKKVVLEDLDLTPKLSADTTGWATWLGAHLFPKESFWQTALLARICIVSDNVMNFLLETATEVTARIRLDSETKTVAPGALWYEEALPSETILFGLLVAAEVKAKPDEVFKTVQDLVELPLQVGGNATVGRGFSQVRLV